MASIRSESDSKPHTFETITRYDNGNLKKIYHRDLMTLKYNGPDKYTPAYSEFFREPPNVESKVIYYVDGIIHRDNDEPAVKIFYPNKYINKRYYYKNGKLHREGDKPAVIIYDRDGNIEKTEFYIDGTKVNNSQTPKNPPNDVSVGNNIFIDDIQYNIKSKLGQGAFATVYELQVSSVVGEHEIVKLDKGLIHVACKVATKTQMTEREKSLLKREISIHKKLSHPNILPLLKLFEDTQYVYILLELCSLSLYDVLKTEHIFMKNVVINYATQLINGLYYLHDSMHVLHRDIKPHNIIVCGDSLKIADFGLATNNINIKMSNAGTPNYISPEILNGDIITYASDIWSFGCVLFVMIFGYPPFQLIDAERTQQNIIKCNYKFPSLNVIDSDNFSYTHKSGKTSVVPKIFIEYITKIFNLDASERPSARELSYVFHKLN